MSDVVYIDNSTLTAVATCDTQAVLRYVLGLTIAEDSGPLRAGHMAHAVLASYLQGASIAEIVETHEVMNYLAWATDALPEDDRLATANVLKILSRWIETHPLSGLPFRVDPSLIEVGFAVPLADDVVFVGRMDGLVQDDNGAWFVLEHKTTGRLDEQWRRRYRTSAQITGYVWAAQQHLGQPVAGCFVNGIEFGRLPTDTKRCRTHGVPYPECSAQHARFDMLIEHRAPHQLETWKRNAIKLARKFKALKLQADSLADIADVTMFGQLNGACSLCQFADFCAVGRPITTGEAILTYQPWSPYAHAFQPTS
jgi:hypothetical protein